MNPQIRITKHKIARQEQALLQSDTILNDLSTKQDAPFLLLLLATLRRTNSAALFRTGC
jgi:hypothetical protein